MSTTEFTEEDLLESGLLTNEATQQMIDQIRNTLQTHPGTGLPSAAYLQEIKSQPFNDSVFSQVSTIYDRKPTILRNAITSLDNLSSSIVETQESTNKIYGDKCSQYLDESSPAPAKQIREQQQNQPIATLPHSFLQKDNSVAANTTEIEDMNRVYESMVDAQENPIFDIKKQVVDGKTRMLGCSLNVDDQGLRTTITGRQKILCFDPLVKVDAPSRNQPMWRRTVPIATAESVTKEQPALLAKPAPAPACANSAKRTESECLLTKFLQSQEKLLECMTQCAKFATDVSAPTWAVKLYLALARVGCVFGRKQTFANKFEQHAFFLVADSIFTNLCNASYESITNEQVRLFYCYVHSATFK